MPADQIGERWASAAIGNVRKLNASHQLEQHGAEMDAAADAGRRVVELAGLRFRERDEFSDRLRRNRGVDGEDVRIARDEAECSEIPPGIVSQSLVERGADRERRDVAEKQSTREVRWIGARSPGRTA